MSVQQRHIDKAAGFPADTMGGSPAYWDRLERTLAILDGASGYPQSLHLSAEIQPLSYIVSKLDQAIELCATRGLDSLDYEEVRDELQAILEEERIEREAARA